MAHEPWQREDGSAEIGLWPSSHLSRRRLLTMERERFPARFRDVVSICSKGSLGEQCASKNGGMSAVSGSEIYKTDIMWQVPRADRLYSVKMDHKAGCLSPHPRSERGRDASICYLRVGTLPYPRQRSIAPRDPNPRSWLDKR